MSDKPLLTKWRLLMRAVSDQHLTGADLRVLPAVLDRMDSETLECWPGYGRIANDTGTSRRTATRSIERLVSLGYLEKKSRGDRKSNRYKLGKLSTLPPIDSDAPMDSQTDSGSDSQTDRVSTAMTPPLSVQMTPEPDSLNPPNEPDSLNLSNGQSRADRFSDFWKAYPRKEAKAPAAKSWQRQKLDKIADTIIADVEARKHDRGQWAGKERQFIPLPATYLNAKRWTDEWTPANGVGRLPREEMTQDEIDAFNRREAEKLEATR